MGWTQTRIAKAKGVSNGQVSKIMTYASLPNKIIKKFREGFLFNVHAAEIVKCFDSKLEPWLTREDAMLHVVNNVTKNATFTANHFRMRNPQIGTMYQS